MENRPTIQASLASGAPLRLARAIRRMPEPMAAAMRVRYHILNVAMGRHVKWLTSAIGAVVLGVPLGIIFLAGGLGHGEKDLAPLLVGGVLSLLGLYGLITLPICLCLLHRINSEAGQCA